MRCACVCVWLGLIARDTAETKYTPLPASRMAKNFEMCDVYVCARIYVHRTNSKCFLLSQKKERVSTARGLSRIDTNSTTANPG